MNHANIIRAIRKRGAQTPVEHYLLDLYSAPVAVVVALGMLVLAGLAGYMLFLAWQSW